MALMEAQELREMQGEISNEQLACQAQAGCAASFEELVLRLQRPLFNYARQILRNDQDAEDVTQESFVKAHRALARYDNKFRFTTWLFTITRNTAVTHLRRRPAGDGLTDEEWSRIPAEQADAPEVEAGAIWQAARTLKPKQYEALWLFYGEGFSIAEVAAIMKSNQIYVKVMLHRARISLAKKLKGKEYAHLLDL